MEFHMCCAEFHPCFHGDLRYLLTGMRNFQRFPQKTVGPSDNCLTKHTLSEVFYETWTNVSGHFFLFSQIQPMRRSPSTDYCWCDTFTTGSGVQCCWSKACLKSKDINLMKEHPNKSSLGT